MSIIQTSAYFFLSSLRRLRGDDMSGFARRWNYFWLAPAPATNLALCRIAFFGLLCLFYIPQNFTILGEVSSVFWQPIWLFRVLRLPQLSPAELDVLQTIWKAALALACVGLFTRVSTVLAFTGGVYLLGMPYNFGWTYHYDALLVIALGIMAFSRCGDAYSVDHWFQRIRRASRSQPPVCVISGEYTWPFQTVRVLMALVLVAAGLSKLRHTGLPWIFSDNMAILLLAHQYHWADADPLTAWGPWVAQYFWLCQLLAASTVLLQLSFPLALVSARARSVLVPMSALFLIGIRLLMGPTFEQFMIIYVFWVPWRRVHAWGVNWLRSRGGAARGPTLEAISGGPTGGIGARGTP